MSEPRTIFINRANRTQLETVEQFDKNTIDAILNHRREKGRFASIDELGELAGMDAERLELIRQRVKFAN